MFVQRLISLILFVFCLHIVYGQDLTTDSKRATNLYNDAIIYYNMRDYRKAIEYLESAIKADENFIEAYLTLGEVYLDAGNVSQAMNYYKHGLNNNPTFFKRGYLNLGKMQLKSGLYADAKQSYETFLTLEKSNTSQIREAKEGIKKAEFGKDAVENPVPFEIKNLGPNINTKYDDYWPSLSADEQMLVITGLRPKENDAEFMPMYKYQEDFFISHRTDTGWSAIENAGPPLNTSDNEGAQSISADGRLMVFTACNRMDGVGRCDLYYSLREGDTWSKPKNIGTPVNSSAKETQPSLSADGRVLFFASDREGGVGRLDIWVTKQNDKGVWESPKNLGRVINTVDNEMSPFIHPDNKTLYFASDKHLGLGGYDIFISRVDSMGNWSKPQNLGYPINTHRDEFGLIVNTKGDRAYFSSDINPKAGKDIFEFELYEEARPTEVSYMKGKVFDAETRNPLKANFELTDLESGEIVGESFSDKQTGEFLVCIPTNRDYMLNVSRKGYLFFSENFALKGLFAKTEPFKKDVPLQPIKAGESIVLRNIFFATDSYALKEESKLELNKLIKFLTDYPTIKVEISGHTDKRGTAEYNIQLSENRAKSVVDYLIDAGIAEERLSYKGYGFTQPIADNETEEGMAQNRRTELKVVEQ